LKLRLTLPLMLLTLVLHADPLSVASAKGYKKPMMQLFEAFEKQYKIPVTPIFGNMRQTIAQSRLSGKVSLIIGDRAFLEHSALSVAAYIPLGRGKLVLAYPKGSGIKTIADLENAALKRIALPDPKKAIYGKAAMQYLRQSGLFAKIGEKLLVVGTVPQVSSYLITNEVDAGFINLTDALNIRDKIGGYIEADPALYSSIEIVCAVLSGHENDAQADAFTAFLNTPEARALLEASGL